MIGEECSKRKSSINLMKILVVQHGLSRGTRQTRRLASEESHADGVESRGPVPTTAFPILAAGVMSVEICPRPLAQEGPR